MPHPPRSIQVAVLLAEYVDKHIPRKQRPVALCNLQEIVEQILNMHCEEQAEDVDAAIRAGQLFLPQQVN